MNGLPEEEHVPESGLEALPGFVDAVSEALDADVFFYNGPIDEDSGLYSAFIDEIPIPRKRPNALLILLTMGGDPDEAYRIARLLRHHYASFKLYVPNMCKSAGTLIATGADELVIAERGELGPLDVQLLKRDEIAARYSGLTIQETLTKLEEAALRSCEQFFLNLIIGSGGSITLKTATEVATNMTTGLFAPLYGQVDPMLLGETERAMRIGLAYGKRLIELGKNLTENRLKDLISEYPSHGFVINYSEAKTLFNRVREPSDEEQGIVKSLGILASRVYRTTANRVGPFKLQGTAEVMDTEEEGDNGDDGTGTGTETETGGLDSESAGERQDSQGTVDSDATEIDPGAS